VKLSNENQFFLNVKRPSRVRIPATLLEERVAGFKAGVPMFLKVGYVERAATSYHRYVGGDVWVPTAPREIGRPGDALTVRVEPLTLRDFLSGYPCLRLRNERSRAWMADQAEVRVSAIDDLLSLEIKQSPPVEGISSQVMQGKTIGGLVFQTGTMFANFGTADAFGAVRKLRLYHNGNTRAWPGVDVAHDFFRVYHLTVDGVRLRLAYAYTKGFQTTTVYLRRPSSLYELGATSEIPNRWPISRISKAYLVRSVRPLRDLERQMLKHGNNYEVGRLGAEIAYTVLSQEFGCENLVLNEPAKGGKDLQTSDLRVAAQSRLLVHYEPGWLEWVITKELKQMTWKLRIDLGHTRKARVGYAVLSFLQDGELRSLVAEVQPKR
jgi:hypothetical protein